LGQGRLAGMEKTRSEKIKEFFLAGFVITCVVLIFVIWSDALSNKVETSPYFYRGEPTLSESFYATRTAIAESALLGTGTPTLEVKHHEEMSTHTLTPTSTPTPFFTPEADT